MGNRKSAAESLDAQTIQAICDYYKEHNVAETARKFNLSRSAMNIFCKLHNLPPHSFAEANLYIHLHADGYDEVPEEQRQEIVDYYKTSSAYLTAEHFAVKEYFVNYLLHLYNITPHTKREEQIATNKALYSPTWGDKLHLQPSNVTPEEIKEKARQTKLERYGDPNFNNRAKCIETCQARYGCDNTFQVEELKQKSSTTKQERYGDTHFTNRVQAKKTCQERYGANTFLGSEKGKEAIKQYNQATYGTDYAFLSTEWQNNPEIRQKRCQTARKNKYSAENYSDLYLSLFEDPVALADFCKDKSIYDIAQQLQISRDNAYYLLSKNNLLGMIKKQYTGISHYEQEIADYIGADLCEMNSRTVLSGKEIDIYIPSKKIGIEFNGTYWHSTEVQPDKNYHFNKSKSAEAAGIRLIHIWEYEWEDPTMREKIKLMLDIALGRVKSRVYARNCEIRQITNAEAAVLNEQVHLQGHRAAQVTYGLFYEGQLVQLMSFSHTRYNRNISTDTEWEIIRGCPGSNNIVVGGVSKLLKHFITDYRPSKIFSYCDFNKFDGRSYEAAGMQFAGYTGPDMKWLLKNGQVVNRKPRRHAELKDASIAQLFGAGSKKYIWTKSI